MATKADKTAYREFLKRERDAIFLYERLAKAESNEDLARIYKGLAAVERKHAETWEAKLKEAGERVPHHKPGWRTALLGWFAGRFGVGFVLPTLVDVEKGAGSVYRNRPETEAADMASEEQSHARLFRFIAQSTRGLEGGAVARVEGRHRSAGGNALRAGVLGANDGLVSVFSLVMGVAGAGISSPEILLTGMAGLLAGALSMALGEWLSVQSSRELYKHQIGIEEKELAANPEEEKEELTLIYRAKGIAPEQTRAIAEHLLSDGASVLDTLAREELSIDPRELGGSAWVAALTSFLLFAGGAIIPVIPYTFLTATLGIIVSAAVNALELFVIGAAITLMTGRNVFVSGFRQVAFGLATAAVTFGIGKLIGMNIRG